jgi:hypothetical protein
LLLTVPYQSGIDGFAVDPGTTQFAFLMINKQRQRRDGIGANYL